MPADLARTSTPPLIKILGSLGAVRNIYWKVPCSDERRGILRCISTAAVEADRSRASFTRQFVLDYLGRLECPQGFCRKVQACLDGIDGEIDEFGEILAAIEWVCKEVSDRTGLSISEVEQTIDRKGEDNDEPMDGFYGRPFLNKAAERLHELDVLGHGEEIWRTVVKDCRVIRIVATGATKQKRNSRHKVRGRPVDTNLKEDARILDAWSSGSYSTYEELGRAFHKTKYEAERIVDR